MANKELSPEMRIVLAFALSFIILLISRPLLVRNTPPAPASKQTTKPGADKGTSQATSGTPDDKAAAQATAPAVPAEPAQGEAEEQIVVEGDLYRVVFSTRGAVVKSWTLKGYKDGKGNPLELVNPDAAAKFGDPLSIWVADENLRKEVNGALFVSSEKGTLQAPAILNFEFRDAHVAVRKQFVFSQSSYVVKTESDLVREGKPIAHELAWRGSFGDIHDAGVRGARWDVFYRDPQRVERLLPGNIDNRGIWTRLGQWLAGLVGQVAARPESVTSAGEYQFAGIEDHFFCAAFLPQGHALQVTTFEHSIAIPDLPREVLSVGVAVGSGEPSGNRMGLYVGPKDSDVLSKVQPGLTDVINYGTFWFIAKPLFLSLRWIYDHIVGNYGWAIILLTIVINMLLFPLKTSSMRSARKMQKIAPEMKAIQEKYKQMKLNDPRRQQMSQESMELYKKHGVNPLGSCLPMLLQIPFLWAFYQVLQVAIEMRHAPWIHWWVPDLSSPEPHAIKILPLLMCGTQFVVQKMSPTPSPDPAQQKIMLFMPIMMLFIFYYFSSGLVLYYMVQNLLGIGQQWYINRSEQQHAIAQKRDAAAKKKKK